jgi:hypothetical protein
MLLKSQADRILARHRSRVIFTAGDVGKLGLAYWLFRSGLRTRAIQDVFGDKEVTDFLRKLASPEAMEAETEKLQFLVSWRVPRSKGRQEFGQEVRLVTGFEALTKTIEGNKEEFGLLVVPLGRLFHELAGRFRKYVRELEGDN